LAQQIVSQISEYRNYGFDIRGIVGVNRSPTCGVDTTSRDNREVHGEGVFIEALRTELETQDIQVNILGIKAFEPEKAAKTTRALIGKGT
jgi:predicted secreted protein